MYALYKLRLIIIHIKKKKTFKKIELQYTLLSGMYYNSLVIT